MPGASDNVCDETYTGTEAFSEPETRYLSEFIAANKDTIRMNLAFHSYSQLILIPFSYTDELPEDIEMIRGVAEVAATNMRLVHGVDYGVIPFHDLCKLKGNVIVAA